ncbi:MAG: protoglobin domain-containing protein [Chloroflexaceae bacterium]|jgi:hypothetical protein|nr:protoglobin domain-containing protein [Chloroflexaceae bacterium]
MQQNRKSWAVKDTALLTELVEMLEVTEVEAGLLGELQGAARELAPTLVDAFYNRLLEHENTAEYLQGKDMQRLHGAVGDWFVALFSGNYDEAYVRQRLKIGQIHVQIGLPIRYPLAMLDVILAYGEFVAQQSSRRIQAVTALQKVIALDVAIFNQAYEDYQIQHLANLVGNERLARRLLSARSLGEV